MGQLKRLVIGDIHGHWDNFKQIYDKEDPDEVIVLGDYFDNFHGTDEDIIQCMKDMIELQSFHIKNKRGCFYLLIGNHDYHYMTWIEKYSGYRRSYATEAKRMLDDLVEKKRLQYVLVNYTNKTIYSHAGVTNKWLKENVRVPVDENNIDCINTLPVIAYRFTYKGGGDEYGNSMYASPIWVRPETLHCDMFKDSTGEVWTQVVGHTHTNRAKVYEDKLYQLDCMPYEYMVEYINIEDDKLISREIKQHQKLTY